MGRPGGQSCLLFVLLAQPPPADLREAARLDSEGKCSESEAIYQRALASGTPSPALWNNAGNHYVACGNAAKARQYFGLLLRRNPSHPNANLQMARLAANANEAAVFLRALTSQSDPALWMEAGIVSARLGDFASAQQTFQRVASARPEDFEALWNLGRAAARAGDYTRARQALESALRLKPEDPHAMLELGLAHAASGDSPRAVFLLAQAEAKMPNQPGVTLALARAAEDAGYYGDAVIAYDRYLKMQPADEPANRDRARVLANTPGGREQGLKSLEEYVSRRPADPAGHFQLAQLIWETNPERSLEHLGAAVKLDPKLAPAHTARAWLLHRMGREQEALAHLESALKVTPADVRALDQYGLVLAALDRPGEAEKALRHAAALAPEDWQVRLHLGRTLMEQGREAEARTWLDQYQKLRPARQRDPRREPGMIELATMSAAARRAREIERFRSMAQSRPDDAVLRMHLGNLLLADGRDTEAGQEYRRLLTMNAEESTLAQTGRALLDARRYEWALPFLEKSGARLDLALAQYHTSGAAEALKTLSSLPEQGEVLLLKARILDGAGRREEARALLDKAIASGARPQIAEQTALLLAAHGRFQDAMRLLTPAIAAAPGDRDLLLSEAIVLALDGQTTQAKQRLKRIEERWPEWAAPRQVMSPQKPPCQSLRDWLQPQCREAAR